MAKSTVFDLAALTAAPHTGPRSILRLLQVFARLSAYPEGQTGRAMLAYLPDAEVKSLLEGVRFERITPATVSSRRVSMAGLKEVRDRGVSTVDSGTVVGVVSVAAPIFGADGHVIAALSIGGPSARIGRHLSAVESAVRDSAEEVSRVLGYGDEWPPMR